MNKQLKMKDGKVVGRGIEWTDFTWNPIAGCFHACSWSMPDGTIANCYAEDVADRVAGGAYPNGFEYNYWKPNLLKEPINQKKPSRIFVGSMADVFGHWVEKEHILQVLDTCNKAPQHTFQFLTKNIKRVWEFANYIPKNCWIGASTPPNFMWNKPLSEGQRERWLETVLDTLNELRGTGMTTWLSAEPLTIDVGFYIGVGYEKKPVDWMVIGAASNGNKLYAPDEKFVRRAVKWNDEFGIPTFFKGNLKTLPFAVANWREEYPESEVQKELANAE